MLIRDQLQQCKQNLWNTITSRSLSEMAEKDILMLESFWDSDSAFESDDMDFDEVDCTDPLAMSCRCHLHEGLRIEISEHTHSMRQVANIVIALQKLQKFKHVRKVQSTEFTDHELFNIIMESVVEESVEIKLHCEPSQTYNKQDRVIQCTVCDSLKKNLVQSQGAPILLAVTLKGGSSSQSVPINLTSYITPACTTTDGLPVCLGIAQSNLYLACDEVSGTPHLSLMEVKDKETLNTIHENDDMERFLFRRKLTGNSANTFESVKYPGWFISTSKDESMPVDMCKAKDASRYKDFSLQNQKVV